MNNHECQSTSNIKIPDGNEELHRRLTQIIEDLNFDVQLEIEKANTPQVEIDLTDDEKRFLSAIERGDIPTAKYMIDNIHNKPFNISCVDRLGRNALHITIENEHTEMLEILLANNFEIGDGLLHAISEENIQAVEIILNAMSNRPKKKDLTGLLGNQSSTFTSDITPLILAAHRDNYPIIKILLDRGDCIPKPHDLKCSCHDCISSQREDSLRHSQSRINAYKALASPSLICLSSKDPILTAFELSVELKRLGNQENEFKDEYDGLSQKCQIFATELLAQTRCSKELAVVLNHDHGQIETSQISTMTLESVESNDDATEMMTLSRLKLAIDYKQKNFVVHPHCQQLLDSLWYESLPGLRRLPFIKQTAAIGTVCVSFPVLSCLYIVAPSSRYGRLLRRPFIKFLCHNSSYLFFILLIAIISTKLEEKIFGTFNDRIMDRGPAPTYCEWGIIIYVIGYVWKQIAHLYLSGVKAYLANMWNLLDFATNSMYITIFLLRLVAYLNFQNQDEIHVKFVTRDTWEAYEPVLISECLFSGANIFSVLKLIFIFTLHPKLGPLQISLGRMLGDVLKFFSIYVLVLVAYTLGMVQLNWYYESVRYTVCRNITWSYYFSSEDLERYKYCVTQGRYFTDIFQTAQSLYWTSHGLIDLTNLNLEYQHGFTEFVGKLMLGSYTYITVIMLFNMFIAMMNNSFQKISESADREWKFARSKMLLSYFEGTGGTVPVPFNLLPTTKFLFHIIFFFKQLFCGCIEKNSKSKWKSIRKLVKKVNEKEAAHQNVMKDLTKRYIINRQKSVESQGVTEDDLNELKGDINSFRYELIEILRMNGMKTPAYMQRQNFGKLRRKVSKKGFSNLSGADVFKTDMKYSDTELLEMKNIIDNSLPNNYLVTSDVKIQSLNKIAEILEDATEANVKMNQQLLDTSNGMDCVRSTDKSPILQNCDMIKQSGIEITESPCNIQNDQRSDMV